jgi:hypothetical protein
MDSFGMTQNGVGVWPNVDNTNAYFGGLDLNVKNLIMTNGSEVIISNLIIFLGPMEACFYILTKS